MAPLMATRHDVEVPQPLGDSAWSACAAVLGAVRGEASVDIVNVASAPTHTALTLCGGTDDIIAYCTVVVHGAAVGLAPAAAPAPRGLRSREAAARFVRRFAAGRAAPRLPGRDLAVHHGRRRPATVALAPLAGDARSLALVVVDPDGTLRLWRCGRSDRWQSFGAINLVGRHPLDAKALDDAQPVLAAAWLGRGRIFWVEAAGGGVWARRLAVAGEGGAALQLGFGVKVSDATPSRVLAGGDADTAWLVTSTTATHSVAHLSFATGRTTPRLAAPHAALFDVVGDMLFVLGVGAQSITRLSPTETAATTTLVPPVDEAIPCELAAVTTTDCAVVWRRRRAQDGAAGGRDLGADDAGDGDDAFFVCVHSLDDADAAAPQQRVALRLDPASAAQAKRSDGARKGRDATSAAPEACRHDTTGCRSCTVESDVVRRRCRKINDGASDDDAPWGNTAKPSEVASSRRRLRRWGLWRIAGAAESHVGIFGARGEGWALRVAGPRRPAAGAVVEAPAEALATVLIRKGDVCLRVKSCEPRRDAIAVARHRAAASPSILGEAEAHELCRALGCDVTAADEGDFASMLFLCRGAAADPCHAIFELLCDVHLALAPGALPRFVGAVDACKAHLRPRRRRRPRFARRAAAHLDAVGAAALGAARCEAALAVLRATRRPWRVARALLDRARPVDALELLKTLCAAAGDRARSRSRVAHDRTLRLMLAAALERGANGDADDCAVAAEARRAWGCTVFALRHCWFEWRDLADVAGRCRDADAAFLDALMADMAPCETQRRDYFVPWTAGAARRALGLTDESSDESASDSSASDDSASDDSAPSFSEADADDSDDGRTDDPRSDEAVLRSAAID